MRRASAWVAVALGATLGPGVVRSGSDAEVRAAAPSSRTHWIAVAPGDDPRPIGERLTALIAAQAARGEVRLVTLGATWCGPCRALERYRDDPRMVAAFEGALVIHLDVDEWKRADLEALGYATGAVPIFFAVDAKGHATGPHISGEAWGEDIPENMAPPLARFVAALKH